MILQAAGRAYDGQSGNDGPGPSTLRHARRMLVIQYQARIPPRSSSFLWPPLPILLRIQDHLDNDLFKECRYQATARYRILFLRELYARLDAAVQAECEALRAQRVDEIEFPEIDAALLERYVEAMSSGSSDPSAMMVGSTPDTEFTTHCWPQHRDSFAASAEDDDADLLHGYSNVTIREEGSAISKGTTGLRTWEAGLRLAAHLIQEPATITSPGTRILELGSGAGFVGAVCAVQQLKSPNAGLQTYMTDVPGQVMARIRDTLHVNDLDSAASMVVKIQELDWLELCAERQQTRQRDDLPTLNFLAEAKPTLILAADVVYDPDLIDPFVETIRTCLQAGPNACRALVASTIRNPATYDAFKASLSKYATTWSVCYFWPENGC